MRHVASNVLTLLVPLGILLIAVIGYGRMQVDAEGPLAQGTTVIVEKGMGLREISGVLEDAGAVSSGALFRLAASYSGAASRLKFGEYEIPAGASVAEILAKLESGDTIAHRVVVAEGLSSWEVVELLRADEILTGEIAEVPEEGSLAPNTYFVNRGDTREGVIARMQADQARILSEAWRTRSPETMVRSPQEVLVLASIVEKETGVADERPMVASVFNNRLRRGMRLQSDPTIIYGINGGKGGLGRGIRRSELNARTPYNTYQIDGLPPTPIANPGKAAIEAVVNPASTNFVYFVADGTGGHAFSETLEEHNRNVARWRQIERERQQSQ